MTNHESLLLENILHEIGELQRSLVSNAVLVQEIKLRMDQLPCSARAATTDRIITRLSAVEKTQLTQLSVKALLTAIIPALVAGILVGVEIGPWVTQKLSGG